MLVSGIGISFVGICVATGGLLTYMGIDHKYKLVDRSKVDGLIKETIDSFRGTFKEEETKVNDKMKELQEENMNLKDLFTEITTKNELLEQVNNQLKDLLEQEQEKNKGKKGNKKTAEVMQDSILQAEAERLAASAEFQDYPLPTEDDIPFPSTPRGKKKTK